VAAVVGAWAASVLASCVAHPIGPARTFDAYEGKATTTAESARSAVQTVRLLADASSRGNAFGTYVGVAVSEQEDALDGLQGTFRSIQPPDGAADELRRELDELLARALDHVIDVRVAVRRAQLHQLDVVAEPLEADAEDLEAFIEAHS
jgi:hypothetical protein